MGYRVLSLDRNFVAVQSGIEVRGEQRGAAVADYDEDGRVDLAIAQSRGATRLFKNESPQRWLRVKLRGPTHNPRGIGSAVRIGDGVAWGPGRELHGGGGYGSQEFDPFLYKTLSWPSLG